MTPAGLAAVEAAKASGQWEAAARREDIRQLPPELDEVLQTDTAAMAAYQKMAPSLIQTLSERFKRSDYGQENRFTQDQRRAKHRAAGDRRAARAVQQEHADLPGREIAGEHPYAW